MRMRVINLVFVGRAAAMADDEQELVGLEGARECPETPVSAGRIREWRNWLRNGWLLRETVAIVKIAAPMVR